METLERPGYYAVIPADVRYDDQIPANAKLLYGEISALIGKDGFCYAANEYFQQLYGISERTVRRLIGQLQEQGYLCVELEKDEKTGQVVRRKIFLKVSAPDERPGDKIVPTPGQNCPHPPDIFVQGTLLETNTRDIKKEKNIKKESSEKKFSSDSVPQKVDFDPLPQMVAWIKERFGMTGDRDGMNGLYLALFRFTENRATLKKPMKSQGAVTALCNRLSRLCGNDMGKMISILDDATCNGWQSVYDRNSADAPAAGGAGVQRKERVWLE